MSLIAESKLRKLVREMLLEAETPASQAAGAVAQRAGTRVSAAKFEQFKKFIADVLAGSVVVSKSKNTTDQNLFVNAFLSFYGRFFLKGELPSAITAGVSALKAPSAQRPGVSLSSRSPTFGQAAAASINENADELYSKMTSPTSYPESAVKYAQKKMNLQYDGDFGRQTMVALASGGKIKITPTNLLKLQKDRKFRDLIAALMANQVYDFDADTAALEAALAQPSASPAPEPQSTPMGPMKGPPGTQLPDAPPPPMVNTAASNRPVTLPSRPIDVRQPGSSR